ncbi:glutamate--cysteine ligase [Rhodococcus electrodiphilus]|uniref:carboxylate-amine ligase n=1 Tax=Rhodococcus ruber TaxID=1830 RepID=UPI0026F42BFF|nr:glutamate--cysteine ligase [Rhodococcus ruber]MDO2381668.1 glutamate--cysteine ligase [Rhodococcus ruber]
MATSSDLPTVGVEEEFLLVDAETGEPAVNNSDVVEQARALGVELQYELDRCQVETASGVCHDAHELYTDLSTRRSLVAEAARRCGSRLVAVGVPVVGSRELPVTEKPRYLRMERHFGMLAREQGICGCHVHVAVPDRATAVQVSNHLRPWLPTLLSLSANSPIHRGVDTGYASWRSILWSRWPSAGPPPYFSSVEEYDSTVAAMLECGSILDKAMVYWDVRPSTNFPTVEVRVCDVPVTVAETVLVAVLVRALVLTALRDLEAGRTAVAFSSEVLRAAYWRAARDGLPGDGIDLPSTARRPAAHLLRAMIEHVRPALEDLGSYQQAREGLHAVLGCGNGAVRQRRVVAAGGTAQDVIARLAELTSAGCTH